MRKLLISALVAATVGGVGSLAMAAAHADSTCRIAPSGAPVSIGQLANDGAGNSGLQICITGTGAIDGTVTVAGSPNTGAPQNSVGYIVADGAPTNSLPLTGYVGVSSGDDGGVVGCFTGEFQPAEASETSPDPAATDTENNQILGIPPAVPSVPPATSSCNPPTPPVP